MVTSPSVTSNSSVTIVERSAISFDDKADVTTVDTSKHAVRISHEKLEFFTSNTMINPVIEGFVDGMSVDGRSEGAVVGFCDGGEVMNTKSLTTNQSSPMAVSNVSVEISTSSVFVASTMRLIFA